MRQGHMDYAQVALAEADQKAATPTEQLMLHLESAALHVYRGGAVQNALQTANTALAATQGLTLSAGARAEAERIHIRILLMAATYREISFEEGRAARDRLPNVVEGLEQTGRIDEALAARLTYAEQLNDSAVKLEALADFAKYAAGIERGDYAGKALVERAELLLSLGAPGEDISADLAAAYEFFSQMQHVYGAIDIERILARLSIERELSRVEKLEACVEAYHHLDYPSAELNVLLELSQLAHNRGDTAAASTYRVRGLEVADAAGLGLARDSFQMAQADLLMRSSDYNEAIELCQAAITTSTSPFFRGQYENLLAAAYGLLGDDESAVVHGRNALHALEALGDQDAASDAVISLANELTAFRQDKHWNEADALLAEWLAKDKQRGALASAIGKYEVLVQSAITRFSYSPSRSGDPDLLRYVRQAILEAEALVERLPPTERAVYRGAFLQFRGHLSELERDEEGFQQGWRDALAVYEQAGLALQAANCRYILGTHFLNRANESLFPNFGEAERNLIEALEFYDFAGMKDRSADTRFMLARLYVNTALVVHSLNAPSPDLSSDTPADVKSQLLDASMSLLGAAEADYDTIRREYNAGSALDAQPGKYALIGKSRRIYELALEVSLDRASSEDAWQWAQRAKARALADSLGTSSVLPTRVLDAIKEHPESFSLVNQELELLRRLNASPGEERLSLRRSLTALRTHMTQDPHLAEFLELRTGVALDYDAFSEMLRPETGKGRDCVCVDWVTLRNSLVLFVARPGQAPQFVRLSISLDKVRSFVVERLDPKSFRQTLRDAPALLRTLDPLIEPLTDFCAPTDLLIFSPTGPLNAIPLHALQLEGAPLVERNPSVYCPSLSVLRHCLGRQRLARLGPSMALLGDPNEDRAEAASLVTDLAQQLGGTALVRQEVTREAFTGAVTGHDVVHFQGHARHDTKDPLASYLQLADGRLTARDVFGIRGMQAELVTLAACESAANVIATGDEPLGLIPSFLYAGSNAVVATLWRVHAGATAHQMGEFYGALMRGTDMAVDKAEALRQAMLSVRAQRGWDAPYYWAPFVLYGDWH
jgi:CHAT domain-containing protein